MANLTENDSDKTYDPEHVKELEEQSVGDSESVEKKNDVDSDSVRDQEQSGGLADHANNFTGKNETKFKGTKKLLKGKGAALVVGGGIGLGGIAMLIVLVPGLLLFHVLANMFDTMDPSSTAISAIAKNIILRKLGSNTATTGVCSVVTIGCKFKTPSNELLRQLKANGITAIGANNAEMNIPGRTSSQLYATERPVSFKFTGSGGNTIDIPASGLNDALASNTEFRIVFNKIVDSTKWTSFSRFSPSFLKLMRKFDFSLRNTLGMRARTTADGTKSVKDVVRDLVKLKGADGVAAEAGDAAEKVVVSALRLRVGNLLTLIGKTGKGSGIIIAGAVGCMAAQVPGMIKDTLVSLQKTALIQAAAPQVTAISATQAGEGDEETISELGNSLTEEIDGESGMTSAGMEWTLFGDTDTTSDKTFTKVTPDAFTELEGLTVTDDVLGLITDLPCAALTNPVSSAAIATALNVALGTASATPTPIFALFAINLVSGVAISLALESASDGISDTVANAFGPAMGDMAAPALEKLGDPGQTSGNVLTAGFSRIGAEKGAGELGTPLTVSQNSAYMKLVEENQIAEAELERETLSPFDASSRYTFLGSIVNQLMPYYTQLSSLSGSISTLASLPAISLSSVLKLSSASAADDLSSKYTSCASSLKMTSVDTGEQLACTIFGDPVYGAASFDFDPSALADDMGDAIDQETGIAKSTDNIITDTLTGGTEELWGDTSMALQYDDWLNTCTSAENAAQCAAPNLSDTSDPRVKYSLYNVSYNVMQMIDTPRSKETRTTVPTISMFESGDSELAVAGEVIPETLVEIVSLLKDSATQVHNTIADTFASIPNFTTGLWGFVLWR